MVGLAGGATVATETIKGVHRKNCSSPLGVSVVLFNEVAQL